MEVMPVVPKVRKKSVSGFTMLIQVGAEHFDGLRRLR